MVSIRYARNGTSFSPRKSWLKLLAYSLTSRDKTANWFASSGWTMSLKTRNCKGDTKVPTRSLELESNTLQGTYPQQNHLAEHGFAHLANECHLMMSDANLPLKMQH